MTTRHSHVEYTQQVVTQLYEGGHNPSCVLPVALQLLWTYAASIVDANEGSSESLVYVSDLMHKATGQLVMELYTYRNNHYPMEAED